MKNIHSTRILLILASPLLVLLTSCGRQTERVGEAPLPVPAVHDLVLKNLASEFPGEIHTAEYSNRVQLVVFFRSDDAACQSILPEWSALQEEFQPEGFTLIGILEDNRSPEVLAAEITALDLSWPVGLAEPSVIAAFGGPEALHAIPTAFLLSREGTLMRTYRGFEPIDNIHEDIGLLLQGQELPDRNPKAIAPEDNEA